MKRVQMKEKNRDKRLLIPTDEFEEEASEGLGRLSRDEAGADLRELRERIDRRRRRPVTVWLPAAAAVVILLAASAIFISVLRHGQPAVPELSMAGEAMNDTAYIAMAGPIEREENAPSRPAQASVAPGYERTDNAAGAVAAAEKERAGDAPRYTAAAEKKNVTAAMDDTMAGKADMAVMQAEEEADIILEVVAEGQEEVVVQAVPQPAAAMKARAATRDEAAREAMMAEDKATAYSSAEPLGGWDEYREWITRNIRYPETVRPRVRQVVQVSFTVKADSTLADLRAVRTPGEPFTREAFRLLREGPAWIPATAAGKTTAGETVLTIVFK
jgi:hypothetical protein